MTIEKNVSERKSREKSALYPAITIQECHKFIEQIASLGGKSVSYASVLGVLGLSSPTTKSFLSKISASKQYGFITTGSSTIQLTDIARRILYPSNGEEESKQLLIKAFGNPPLYAKLIERYKDKAVPPKKQLANVLLNEYRIIMQVKDNAAECFIESASYLNLLQNGVLCFDVPDNMEKDAIDDEVQEQASYVLSNENTVNTDSKTVVKEDGYNFEIPTLGKKTARVYIPDGVTEKDIDYISLYIEKMLPVFLENLKSEIK